MQFLKHSKTVAALAVAGILAGHGSAPAAQTDADTVLITAAIVGAMDVISQGDINIGQIPQGTAVDVQGNGTGGSGALVATHFRITGPTGLNWQLSVAYSPLDDGVSPTIAIAAPASAANTICTNDTFGSQAPCTNEGASGDTWTKITEHDGDVSAWVGYSFTVPGAQPAGTYTGSATLTATAILGS